MGEVNSHKLSHSPSQNIDAPGFTPHHRLLEPFLAARDETDSLSVILVRPGLVPGSCSGKPK